MSNTYFSLAKLRARLGETFAFTCCFCSCTALLGRRLRVVEVLADAT